MPPPAGAHIICVIRRGTEIGQPRLRKARPEKDRLEDARIGGGSGGKPVGGPPFAQFRYPGSRRLAEAAHRPIGRMGRNRAAENAVRPPARLPCRLRTVIAQEAHHIRRLEPALPPVEQRGCPAPALMPARKRGAFPVREDIREVESLARLHQPVLNGERFGALARPLEIAPDRIGIGNAALRGHPLHRPFAPHRFEDEGVARIRDDEGIVIFEPALVGAVSALTVFGEERGDDLQRLLGACAALEPEPQQVHAHERRRGRGRDLRMHRLIADHDAVLVRTHFRAPHPEGPGKQHGMGAGGLRNVDISAAEPRVFFVFGRRREEGILRLIRLAVGILCEEHCPARRRLPQRHQRVAHSASLAEIQTHAIMSAAA